MAENERKSVRLPYCIADSNVSSLITACREWSTIDVKFVISYSESDAEGGFMTRPYFRGGPSVMVDVTAPTQHEAALLELVEALKAQG